MSADKKTGRRLVLTPLIEVYHGLASRSGTVGRREDNLSVAFYKVRNTVYVFLRNFAPDYHKLAGYSLHYIWERAYDLIRRKKIRAALQAALFPAAFLAGGGLFLLAKLRKIS